ncbi:hypothetical protein [Kitasatospora sp. NPDC058218]|uniref:hypothetical protein n=1 Tax=Kitasatospora sp. NPDC058218 TaxID=3346385 RepID=UPI0036DF5EAA
MSRAEAGPGFFTVDYRPVRPGEEPAEEGVACAVDAHGEILTVREFSGGSRAVTLVRRYPNRDVEVSSQTLDEPGLRHFLDTLHPLSDAESETLMRERKIDHRI